MGCKPYCHNLLAATSKVVLFDHPVGDGEQHRRHLIPSIRAVCRMLYRADAADEFAHGWPGSSSCRELIKGLPPREKRQCNCRTASTRRCVKRRVRITSRSVHSFERGNNRDTQAGLGIGYHNRSQRAGSGDACNSVAAGSWSSGKVTVTDRDKSGKISAKVCFKDTRICNISESQPRPEFSVLSPPSGDSIAEEYRD